MTRILLQKGLSFSNRLFKRPPLRSHTHCQVAQKAHRQNQNLSISMPALPHRKNAQLLTKNIRHLADGAKYEYLSNKLNLLELEN
jgi:hypothetical protein